MTVGWRGEFVPMKGGRMGEQWGDRGKGLGIGIGLGLELELELE